MPLNSPGAKEGLAISAGVLALTVFFAWKQWAERRDRGEDLSLDDSHYFVRRDQRRWLGTGILGLIGAGMFAGSFFDPRANRWAFLVTWLSVGGLVCVLLVLAMIDWVANRAYAMRHLRLLAAERRALLVEEVKRRSSGRETNGHRKPEGQ